ncbi:hypothetical protein G7Z17_g1882 [Cylindrodendrum hubeiense]|uniref:Zn(2)-C6 fungal-type domain-containing protein n=1 Tax=Cylindrodendrum hubeiense TaxID=595255 RepID=A0A9P5HP69_9HYPO|nr:hypothetical protein G7Z17_g1882 [Cylindrodendrum hubeiense]
MGYAIRPSVPQSLGLFKEAQLATIASQLRIQSILSPADPEVDELSNVSSNHSTPKRKFEEVFTTSEAPLALRRTQSLDDPPTRLEGLGTDPSRGHADEQSTSVPPGARDGKKPMKMRPPMRSSIACMRCRRSKIKCDNDGGNSPCDTCIKGGHQCQYPDATPLPSKRNDSPNAVRQEKEGTYERKRARKVDEFSGLDSERSAAYAEEVLSYPFLTTQLWDQLLNIYRLHFATELSFLHLPTLKEKMSRRQGLEHEPSPELNLVLLGILTLTARFHPDLVKYVAHLSTAQGGSSRPRTSLSKADPSAASEFFANVLATALGPLKTAITVVTVERVQAFLMLGLSEWSQRHPSSGPGAWMYVGIAIRMAQMLKLGLDDQLARGRDGSSQGANPLQRVRRGSSEVGIIREIRRRTMFSCLILDRMMTCGDERVSMIRPDTIRIQLPCTEMAFDLALDVSTGFLNPQGDFTNQTINDDSVLSRFIQLVEIWAEISRYSSTGGRLQERLPPWDKQSMFWTLREKLYQFLLNLPDTFTFSRQNYYRHDNHQATNIQEDIDRQDSDLDVPRGAITGLAYQTLQKMALSLQGAQNYLKQLEDMDQYYTQAVSKFRETVGKDGPTQKSSIGRRLSIRLGGDGTGLEERRPHASRSMKDVSLLTDDELRSNQYEEPDKSRGSNTDRGSPMGFAESYQVGVDYTRTPRSTPGMAFTALNNSPVMRSSSADSVPPNMGTRGEGVSRVENRANYRVAAAQNRSMLMLPGTEPESSLMGIPEFSLDQLSLIESQRIGRMLNDVEEFSGAGSLGWGIPLE